MADPAPGPLADPGPRRVVPPVPGTPPLQRADAWQQLAAVLARTGPRGQALVAARTALALRDRAGASEDELEQSRESVRVLTGPDVVPLHVDLPGGEAGRGGRDEARAVWAGAPADPVLAMIGWVERDGTLDVVRVVVPGTRRGRGSFALLLAALPGCVPVTMRVPARDRALLRSCLGHGFVRVGEDPGGHIGGSARLQREPVGLPEGRAAGRG